MTEQENGTNGHVDNGNGATFTEAPASFNIKAVSPSGYDCMLTIRGTDAGWLVKRALKALYWLADNDFQPTARYIAPSPQPQAQQPSGGNGGQDWPSAEGVKVCEEHNVAMKQRTGKGGDTWHSHKVINPDTGTEFWCRGKAK